MPHWLSLGDTRKPVYPDEHLDSVARQMLYPSHQPQMAIIQFKSSPRWHLSTSHGLSGPLWGSIWCKVNLRSLRVSGSTHFSFCPAFIYHDPIAPEFSGIVRIPWHSMGIWGRLSYFTLYMFSNLLNNLGIAPFASYISFVYLIHPDFVKPPSPMTDQRNDSIQVYLGESMTLFVLIYQDHGQLTDRYTTEEEFSTTRTLKALLVLPHESHLCGASRVLPFFCFCKCSFVRGSRHLWTNHA